MEVARPSHAARRQRWRVLWVTDEPRTPVGEIEQPGLEVVPFGPVTPPGVGLHADPPTNPRPRPERRERPRSEDRIAACEHATVEDVVLVDCRLDAVGRLSRGR